MPALTAPRWPLAVWRIRLDANPPWSAEAVALLDAAERERMRRFLRQGDSCRWVIARAALRRVLGRCLDCEPGSVAFTATRTGKPGIAADRRVYFNLSRSRDLALVAINDRAPVGIDIEWVRHIGEIEDIVHRCFSDNERHAWLRLPPAQRVHGFYRLWTLKESLIKATGQGLTALSEVDVLSDADPAHANRVGSGRDSDGASHFVYGLEPGVAVGCAYVGALTVLNAPAADIQLWELDQNGAIDRAESLELENSAAFTACYSWNASAQRHQR